MRNQYTKPELEVVSVLTDKLLGAASPQDQYSVGHQGSSYEQGSGISDDYGGGPGVSGAKRYNNRNMWED